ncbi:MAG: toprim domain-containing protein [Nitrospiraceae bacterium]|nr:toprim domain-containing protein [Nitrospiraceae bacterium]
MSETFVDFRIVKERVSMQAILDHYNVRLRQANQHSLRGKCPLPTHSSEKSAESFSVQTEKNIWACQSASCAGSRQGKKGGNILDFVSVMENCSIREAAQKLHGWFLSATPINRSTEMGERGREPKEKLVPKKEEEGSQAEINKPLSFTLKDIDPAHPYVRQRGVDEAVARHFGIGYFPGRGQMNGRVVIPIHNEKGELVAYAGRSIDGSEPKYRLPAGFVKTAVLFNLHRVLEHAKETGQGSDVVIVVEGFFDCLNVHRAGLPHVVALMGSSLSDAQETLLAQFNRVILLFDGDDAGRAAALAIVPRLMARTFVKVITLPDGTQPDQLSSDEINQLFSR